MLITNVNPLVDPDVTVAYVAVFPLAIAVNVVGVVDVFSATSNVLLLTSISNAVTAVGTIGASVLRFYPC